MDIRNRMADVIKMRCNACQDFLRMILKPNWQHQLYEKARYEVENSTRNKDKYSELYRKMQCCDINQYSVDEMDVTLIFAIINGRFITNHIQDKSYKALRDLTEDRNFTDHSHENEEPEELYLMGLLALYRLRAFVRIVGTIEQTIDNEQRRSYCQKYVPKIEELMSVLDEERIELVQRIKEMDKDIRKVLDSDDPLGTWIRVNELYSNRYWRVEHNPQPLFDFYVRASDAGIPYAHHYAASHFASELYAQHNDKEAERRLIMYCRSNTDWVQVLDVINDLIRHGYELSSETQEILSAIKKDYKTEEIKTDSGKVQYRIIWEW